MKEKIAIVGAAFLALALPGAAPADEAGSLMEKLATLEGDWVLLDENGEETGQVAATFRMTAGGSVLVERMFPGDENGSEMLNVYHADGDRVLMTHYCAAGNQPRLEVRTTDDANRLQLSFESITNLASPDADHMHQAEYVFYGKDRLTTRWQSMQGGKLGEAHEFKLKRSSSPPE